MRIYSMTATFGKLEHQTLTLEPGLNVISAPNEWGKSTWCAFLAAMLYGLDTRAKSTKTNLADKERYAPWSGSLMSGRIDLNWKGRDITIQRITRKRTPLGIFRAFETESGLEVPELTAENCGQMLLGVERSVFVRTAFIRFQDLNVTDDEALRRRLNNLVTTGSENEDADRLARELKAQRSRIRYNRTGLLPQLEAERDALLERCREWDTLEAGVASAQRQLDEQEDRRMALENHTQALAYDDYRRDRQKVDRAEQARDTAQAEYTRLSRRCADLPARETAAVQLEKLDRLLGKQQELERTLSALPETAPAEALPCQFAGLTGPQAIEMADSDRRAYEKSLRARPLRFLPGAAAALLGAVLYFRQKIPGLACLGVGLLLLIAALADYLAHRRAARRLADFYASPIPSHWGTLARQYAQQLPLHSPEAEERRRTRTAAEQQLQALRQTLMGITGGQAPEQFRSRWEAVRSTWDARDAARREFERQEEHLQVLRSLLRAAPPPEFPDKLTQDARETAQLLEDCRRERSRLAHLQGQYQGRMDALGSREALETRLRQKNARIEQLEQTYRALTIALETLEEATEELQRRFAPQIAARARGLMGRMTGGRYDKLTLGRDLSLQAGAQQEDILRSALWRSDGTMDQMYLALRLAVAQALLPDSPLILDDALLRFDDTRLKAAMEILQAEAETRQVILFTCQGRENAFL